MYNYVVVLRVLYYMDVGLEGIFVILFLKYTSIVPVECTLIKENLRVKNLRIAKSVQNLYPLKITTHVHVILLGSKVSVPQRCL